MVIDQQASDPDTVASGRATKRERWKRWRQKSVAGTQATIRQRGVGQTGLPSQGQ